MQTNAALVGAAARNNARWVDTVCREHGLSPVVDTRRWHCPIRTPLFYPDAISLVPGLDIGEITAGIDAERGASVKDSFADLDLTDLGFDVLFDAQWIHRRAGSPVELRPELECRPVASGEELREWAVAAGDDRGTFRPGLLGRPSARLLAAREAGEIVAGAVATPDAHVVGISNVFAVDRAADLAWPAVVAGVAALFPTLPIVGYEHGGDLVRARAAGFEAIGPLRVWVRG